VTLEKESVTKKKTMKYDYFNSRPLFYSKEHDFYSNHLINFAKYRCPLSKTYKEFVERRKDHSILKIAPIDVHSSIIEGVSCVNPIPEIPVIEPIDYDSWKILLKKVLVNQLNQLDNPLFLLSGGIDSYLLFCLLVDNKIPFTALYLYEKENNEFRTVEGINRLAKSKRYYCDIIFYNYLNVKVKNKKLFHNPPFSSFGVKMDSFLCDILLDSKFKKYSTVLTGFESEMVLGQTKWSLYRFHENFDILNRDYGKYITYEYNEEENLSLENYGGWHARAAKKSQQPRDYLFLESVTGKKFISPYLNKELFISAANLDYEATIKNAYKLPQLDIIKELGLDTSNIKKYPTYLSTNKFYKNYWEKHKDWTILYMRAMKWKT